MPSATLLFQLDGGISGHEARQILGNLLLLLPLGVYGPMLWPRLRSAVAVLALAAVLSAVVELTQLGLATAYGFPVRVADVDDVLLNTVGALIGHAGWRWWTGRPIQSDRHAVRTATDR